MNKISQIILTIICFSVHCFGQTEIPTHTWRTHFNYTSAEKVEFAGNRVYCASQNGLFYFGLDDNSLTKLSKLDGLSDAGVGALKYVEDKNILVLGYKNGNIDFVTESGVKNLDVIKQSAISKSKKYIFDIIENNGILFLSAGLGVVVIDINTLQVKETYSAIGPNASEIAASQVAFLNDSIFVASSLGVLAASYSPTVNLIDFNSWTLYDEKDGIPAGAFQGIVVYGNSLIAHNDTEIYQYNSGYWSPLDFQPQENINSITVSEDNLLVNLKSSIVQISQNKEQVYSSGLMSPFHSLSKNDELWIADNGQGLVRYNTGSRETLAPNGPFAPGSFNLAAKPGSMIALGGGYDPNSIPENSRNGFYLFDQGKWQSFNATADEPKKIPDVEDLVSADYDESTGNTYFASFGDGVLTWTKDGKFDLVDENFAGSPLERNNEGELLVTDVKTDGSDLWILNYGASKPVHRWKGGDVWESFSIGTLYPHSLLHSQFGEKWIIVDPARGGGIVVFDADNALYRRLTTAIGSGRLPSSNVTAIAEDLDGEMWIGTTGGIVYYSQPYLALENKDGTFYSFDVVFPLIENDIFLRDQSINDILVDPGNRKWVATDEGVWVVTGNGGEVVYHFNEENSPLPSKRVLKMNIVKETGEIFFITEKGMVSFRADVSAPNPDYSEVKIFPNPVYPDKAGTVTISGLMDNSIVKITDVSGKLIWETRSSGGTAVWNSSASPLRTGVYLVFTTDEEGSEKIVGKVAVVR